MFLDFDNPTTPQISVPAGKPRSRADRSVPADRALRPRKGIAEEVEFSLLVAGVLEEDDNAASWFDDDRCESISPSSALGISEVRFETVRCDLEDTIY